MDLVGEALMAKKEERKAKLMKFLDVYNAEMEVKKSLKAVKTARDQAVIDFLDSSA